MKNLLLDLMMPILPKNDLSHLVGRLVHRPMPGYLGRKSVELFAKAYNINMNESEFPIEQYKTIGELFTRKLKPGVRPIGEGVVHPADAQITETGVIEDLQLMQAKGIPYTATDLLQSAELAAHFDGGQFLTYYLCPTDYHRVHSPVDGEIISSIHVPGAMWPVNSWSVNKIDNLFAINERIVVLIQTPKGKAALVMVAATNVGNMSMSFDAEISTKTRGKDRKPAEKTYPSAIPVKRGDEIGIFHMGSTVVMLYEKGVVATDVSHFRNRHVKVGQSLR